MHGGTDDLYINVHRGRESLCDSYKRTKKVVYMQCIYSRGHIQAGKLNTQRHIKTETMHIQWGGEVSCTDSSAKEEWMVRLPTPRGACVDPPVLSMLLFTHYNDPHQQLGSSSYIINVAVPYSTHKSFAFVPACRSESIIYSISLTLVLKPK